jgi:peroxiredoxin
MKSIRIVAVLALALFQQAAFANEQEEATRVKVGDNAPDFACRTISGNEFSLSHEKGKVVLITFFATWCGPCLAELPHVQKEILEKYGSRNDFAMIVVGREHQAEELTKFAREKGFSFPIAPDPKREIYSMYAEKFIPRSFVVGKDGKIKATSVGYSEQGFKVVMHAIETRLKE